MQRNYGPLTFTTVPNGLVITPNALFEVDAPADIWEALKPALCNGWDNLRPEEIGALTDAEIILSPDVVRNDDGELCSFFRGDMIYWHERYQIEDPFEALQNGELFLLGVTCE